MKYNIYDFDAAIDYVATNNPAFFQDAEGARKLLIDLMKLCIDSCGQNSQVSSGGFIVSLDKEEGLFDISVRPQFGNSHYFDINFNEPVKYNYGLVDTDNKLLEICGMFEPGSCEEDNLIKKYIRDPGKRVVLLDCDPKVGDTLWIKEAGIATGIIVNDNLS